MQTVSEAAVQGFYYKPRVTLDNLRRHAKGMICTSACIAGIIPKYIDRGDMEAPSSGPRPSAIPSNPATFISRSRNTASPPTTA